MKETTFFAIGAQSPYGGNPVATDVLADPAVRDTVEFLTREVRVHACDRVGEGRGRGGRGGRGICLSVLLPALWAFLGFLLEHRQREKTL